MIRLNADQIACAVSGRIVDCDPSHEIDRISTSTQQIAPGCLFIALKGVRHDAHDYLDAAVTGGASLLLVHDETHANGRARIVVDDTRIAMGKLAQFVRNKFTNTRVIAVAGSNGKTGTKHLIHSVLKTRLRGSMSPKSFNNDIGVPLTLFAVEPDDDYVVVEIGTNHPGEVRHLSLMCQPDIAVITSIGEEHMEFFKSLDGVRDENAHISSGLVDGGLMIINGDDDGLRKRLPHAITFGQKNCDYTLAEICTDLDGTRFTTRTPQSTFSAHMPAIGVHNACNALAAIAIGQALGLSDPEINRGLAVATTPEMRMQKRRIGDVTVLNDAYNANPTSMRAALNTLSQIDWPGRKFVVLGQMRELGELSSSSHQQIRELAIQLFDRQAWFVGSDWQPVPQWHVDAESAGPAIATQLQPGDLILIKGSRSTHMEIVEKAIEDRFNPLSNH